MKTTKTKPKTIKPPAVLVEHKPIFQIHVIDWPTKFEVQIFDGKTLVTNMTWNAGSFNYLGKAYQVVGPAQGFEDGYRIFEMLSVPSPNKHFKK